MKSNTTTSIFKHSIRTLLGACLFLGLANAQNTDATGKFSLPFEATWGGTVLAAGDYSFKVSHYQGSAEIVSVHSGSKIVGTIMASSVGVSTPSNDNVLVAVRNRGQHSIQLLRLGLIGKTYTYLPGKGAKPSLIAQGPRLIERVPITIGGE
jgi:hypothetical protein